MLRQISWILGLGAILTVGTQPAIAQRIPTSSMDVFNLLENRSFEENSQVFFPKISQQEPPYFLEGSIGTLAEENSFEFEVFGEEVIVGAGEFLEDNYFSSNSSPIVDAGRFDFGDVSKDEEVWLLIEIEEWNS